MQSPEVKETLAGARRRMVENDLKGRGISDPAVLSVMGQVPREEFLVEPYIHRAYDDNPLPIGMGQTISQPYMVALMTQALRLNNFSEVLEIGTGSGYQTAVVARLAKKVYTIERFHQLAESAQAVLGRLRFENIEFAVGDGSCGWPGARSFERIIITAATPQIPGPVVEQLAEGGILVAPVGRDGSQNLVVCEKTGGRLEKKTICRVRFVRLLGKYAFAE